jgi:hypothetical protein
MKFFHSTFLVSEIDPDEVVYTSLILTYLSLLCYDNAIFLAERLVAHCPTSENAVYLLAHCYYRNGSPKRARSVLLSSTTKSDDNTACHIELVISVLLPLYLNISTVT